MYCRQNYRPSLCNDDFLEGVCYTITAHEAAHILEIDRRRSYRPRTQEVVKQL